MLPQQGQGQFGPGLFAVCVNLRERPGGRLHRGLADYSFANPLATSSLRSKNLDHFGAQIHHHGIGH